jgi:hypothetical protein
MFSGQGGLAGTLPNVTKPAPGQGILVGPHSVIDLDSVATITSITGMAVCKLNLTGPVSAAHGQELVVAHAAPVASDQPGLPQCNTTLNPNPPASCDSYAQPSVIVGNATRSWPKKNLNPNSPPGDTIVASVQSTSSIEIQMNDGGQAQDLDLRTGSRTREASALYYPPLINNNVIASGYSINYEYDPPGKDGNMPNWGHADVNINGSGDNGAADWAALVPYDETRKWAPAGQAWLLVRLDLGVDDANNFALSYVADVPQSFALTSPDGRTFPASGSASFAASNAGHGGSGLAALTFLVPDTTRVFMLSFTPTGTLTDKWTGASTTLAGGQLDVNKGINSGLNFLPNKITIRFGSR